MKTFMRKRNYFLAGGSFLVLLFAYLTDPNGGAITIAWLQQLTMPVVAVWFAYMARKALFDYLNMEELLAKAKQSTVGAGIVFLAVCIVFFGLLGLFGTSARAQNVTTYVPEKAHIYIPTVKAEQYRLWPDHPKDI